MKQQRTIFGPIPSRRFGLSLGIDLSPSHKQCNFDCLYCELAAARPVAAIEEPPPVDRIVAELTEALRQHPQTETLTITANGEPTLYPHLEELIDRIDALKDRRKTLILSNASTIPRPEVRKALAKLDTVKLSLDCVSERCFRRLDRPLPSIRIADIIEAIRRFRQSYRGELVLEILIVRGLNDTDEEIGRFNRILPSLGADRIDLGTIDRPPAYPVEAVDTATLQRIADRLDPALPVHVVGRHVPDARAESYDDEAILQTLAKRPLTREEIDALFDEPSRKRFERLLQAGKILQKSLDDTTFYGTAFSLQKIKKSPSTS